MVTTVVAMQPVGKVKVIIDVPGEIPVVIPLKEPIVATAVDDEDHVPLEVSVRVVTEPWHILC